MTPFQIQLLELCTGISVQDRRLSFAFAQSFAFVCADASDLRNYIGDVDVLEI